MEHVAKQFTLIDFLGIFAPGAVFVLACNYYIIDLTAPCDSFFGDNAVMLAVYFIALAYLCGSILHHAGAALESRMAIEINVYGKLERQQDRIKTAYKAKFHEDFPSDCAGQIEAGKDVFYYVQRGSRPQRIIFFNAFYTMARTALVLLPVLAVITFVFEPNAVQKWCLILIYAVFSAVFCYQWRVFDQKCIQEAYMLLVYEYISGSKAGS